MKAIVLALVALPLLTACNTLEGIGKDVETAGKVVKETAQENNGTDTDE